MKKAMIMSAGVGSRLDPLTRNLPKPLVPIANKPVMDILFEMKENESEYLNFTFENPIKFAKENITYIVVCSLEKNPTTYKQIRRKRIIGEKYTAPFLERIKSYLFKDAYVYTEDFFEREFVNKFEY